MWELKCSNKIFGSNEKCEAKWKNHLMLKSTKFHIVLVENCKPHSRMKNFFYLMSIICSNIELNVLSPFFVYLLSSGKHIHPHNIKHSQFYFILLRARFCNPCFMTNNNLQLIELACSSAFLLNDKGENDKIRWYQMERKIKTSS